MTKTLDWKKYEEAARQAISEGCVLLENKNNVLPLEKNAKAAVFGRIQNHYYKSGTGSGGMVNVNHVYSIVEGLEESNVIVNKKLQEAYAEWEKTNPYDEGLGWGHERWSQDEMPLTKQIVEDAAKESDVAIVIIGRTAGEEKDNSAQAGSYNLSEGELDMLKQVRAGFKKVVVLLNVGNVIDMTFVEQYQPDAVMYVWQGGMLGGLGTADVLTGKVSPSGKLSDTIAKSISDYPSDKNFGNPAGNTYEEDIFVGYRYFETFAKDKVLYPFGYGLSYSTFKTEVISAQNDDKAQTVTVEVKITNTGKTNAKEVLQLYIQAPNGKLGKAARVLCGFDKTKELTPNESENLKLEIPYKTFASYDDGGVTGKKSAWVLEEGDYVVYAGSDVRSASPALTFNLPALIVIKQCEQALAPYADFERMHASLENGKTVLKMEPAPKYETSQHTRRAERIPAEIPQVTDTKFVLADVQAGNCTMEQFVAQFTDEDLSCICRGEGMGSSLVTPGTASAYGGVSPRLNKELGIPTCCCDDGPSGMRIDCGVKAFSLPNGTSLACSFNRQLVTELYTFTGIEMKANKVDNLLGPGMNIHRHPLNGRNFEYFSEDPYLTGHIGSAMLKGLQSEGVTGTIKHFCGNNQETNRRNHNSVASERALREIYLKGFEIAIENGADSVMTTYGMVNGIFTAGNYDLDTTILRKDWGFTGIVMTDWWATISEEGIEQNQHNFCGMIKAQNDLYMCCSSGKENIDGDNTLESLKAGKLTRGELQRSAMNVCRQAMTVEAMKRLTGTEDKIEIINRPKNPDDIDMNDIQFIELNKEKGLTIDLSDKECKGNSNITVALDVTSPGTYEMTLTGSSEMSETAQIPVTMFYQGIPAVGFTFNGTGGKDVSLTKPLICPNRFCVNRLYIAQNGLKLKSVSFKYLNDNCNFFDIGKD